MPCCSQKSKSSVSNMLVCDRCRLAAAASSSSLMRGETRKLTETVFSAVIALWPCIELHDICNLIFLEGGESQPRRSGEALHTHHQPSPCNDQGGERAQGQYGHHQPTPAERTSPTITGWDLHYLSTVLDDFSALHRRNACLIISTAARTRALARPVWPGRQRSQREAKHAFRTSAKELRFRQPSIPP